MPDNSDISSLRKRRGTRLSLVEKKCNDALLKETVTEDELLLAINNCESNLSIIIEINGKLETAIESSEALDDEALGEEIEKAEESKNKLDLCLLKMKRKLKERFGGERNDTDSRASGNLMAGSAGIIKTKLPNLTLPSFSGNVVDYSGFRERFMNVHNRNDLSSTDKFSYLTGLLTGDAARMLRGLSLCERNYSIALEILDKEYGDIKKARSVYLNELINLKRPSPTPGDIKEFTLTVMQTVRQLSALSFKTELEEVDLTFSALLQSKLPDLVRSKIFSYAPNKAHTMTVEELLELLKRITTELVNETKPRAKRYDEQPHYRHESKSNNRFTAAAVSQTDKRDINKNCTLCSGNHKYWRCGEYASAEEKFARARELNICGRCYRKGHTKRNCVELICSGCYIPGHKKENCYRENKYTPEVSVTTPAAATTAAAHAPIATIQRPQEETTVALPITQVNVKSDKGDKKIRILFDQGSQKTFVTKEQAEQCEFRTVKNENLTLDGFQNRGNTKCYKVVEIPIIVKSEIITITAVVIDSLPERINIDGLLDFNRKLQEKGYIMADVSYADTCSIDVLIGGDQMYRFVRCKQVEGMHVIDSVFGMIPTGPIPTKNSTVAVAKVTTALTIGATSVPGDIDFLWKMDNLGINEVEMHPDDLLAMKNFEEGISYESGKYIAKLPWKRTPSDLPCNYELAKGRLLSNLAQLRKNPAKLQLYDKVIKDQHHEDFIEIVTDSTANQKQSHYLPHHAVLKDSATTPLRIVHNCSQRGVNGEKSLNDFLYTGPNLLPELAQILMRFRLDKIAIVADIRKAFLNVGLHIDDRDFTRFLWVDNPSDPRSKIVTYRFKNVLFGSCCSQFLLNAVVKYHLHNIVQDDITRELERNIYVDNIIYTANDDSSIVNFQKQALEIMKCANMPLVAWGSNSDDVIRQVEPEIRETKEEISVLGLKWNVHEDSLSIASVYINTNNPTKRKVLSGLSSQFDPLGLYSPVFVSAKLLMRELWRKKMDWDDPLDETDSQKWQEIVAEYNQLSDIKVNRADICNGVVSLHACTDASRLAYGCVIYAVQGDKSQILFSKSKLAPEGELSIPKLELTAIALAAKMINYVVDGYKNELVVEDVHIYCDSQVANGWMRAKRCLPTYVQNRVNEVKKQVPHAYLHYINTKENPADLVSRGVKVKQLAQSEIWWNGPPIIKEVQKHPARKIGEESITVTNVIQGDCKNDVLQRILEKSSSLQKAVRITAWLMRVIKNKTGQLDAEELNEAKLKLLQMTQKESFPAEVEFLKHKKGKHTEVIKSLNLMMENDLIVSVSRLDRSNLSERQKRPFLLPSSHQLTRLIIRDCHKKADHVGVNGTLAHLRMTYYLPKARQKIKSMIKSCVICKRESGRPYSSPATPALPNYRVREMRPFSVSGVDYAGPFLLKNNKTMIKRYVALFTCTASRAVHLEMVQDLTANAFLDAFARFVSRRGRPTLMVSDNATNFKKASLILNAAEQVQLHDDVKGLIGCQWYFIPSRTPWFGGFYERLIGLMKTTLRKTIGKALLNEYEFTTVLCKIEHSLNNRPLTYVSGEMNDDQVLTPSLLLGGYRLDEPQEIPMDKDELLDPTMYDKNSLTKRQKYVRSILENYWKRWRLEYLTSLKISRQISGEQYVPVVNDVVLIGDERKRVNWPLGRIVELLPGKDKQVRVAKVKTKHGIIERPIAKLYPLEVQQNVAETQECAPFQCANEVDQLLIADNADKRELGQRPRRNAAKRAKEKIREQADFAGGEDVETRD